MIEGKPYFYGTGRRKSSVARVFMTPGKGNMTINGGGGVAGDMAGFAAATYLRGIEFIQVHPTFLYESLWNLCGFLLINVFFKRKRPQQKTDGSI